MDLLSFVQHSGPSCIEGFSGMMEGIEWDAVQGQLRGDADSGRSSTEECVVSGLEFGGDDTTTERDC